MTPRKPRDDQPLLHTIEESTALLRRCTARAWFWWFAGSAPFVCASLHFCSQMSRAANAQTHLAESAFYLALAYGFMKVAHAVFGGHLLRVLRGEEHPAPLPFRGRVRLVTSQLIIHCTTPWVLTLALAAMLPAGWVFAFYHNANILALQVLRDGGRTRDIFRVALKQCHYRPGQNHGVISVLTIFSILVWMNILAGSVMGIVLMKSFTGTESVFSRNPWLFLSTGFISATVAVSYLIAGPFVKACYAVRCFHGLSRKTGEDIAVRFRAAASPVTAAGVALLLFCPSSALGVASITPARDAVTASRTIDPASLDKNIREVMQEDVFQWRMPRDAKSLKQEDIGWFASFMRDVGSWTKSVMNSIGDFFENLFKDYIKGWLRKLFGQRDSSHEGGPSTPWADVVQTVLYVILGMLAILLGVLLYRQWRKMPPANAAPATALPDVDLKSDQVVATLLAENEWLRLAQEKVDAGEYRLALRALFLATLAHLGEKRLLAIVKSKSNGDYVRELGLRARDKAELRSSFREQTRVFDRSWYGWHDVTRELLDQFRNNHQRIVADVTR